jgi:hypothetical protein
MQNIDRIAAHPVEDPKGIANNRNRADRGAALGKRQMRSMTFCRRRPIDSAIAGLALAL